MKCCKLQNKLCQGLNLSLQIYLCIIVIKFTLHIDTAFFPKDILLFTGLTVVEYLRYQSPCVHTDFLFLIMSSETSSVV
jgi:hypothetical protein